LKNYLKEAYDSITFRRRMVVYLPSKKIEHRQIAQIILNHPRHNQAKLLETFIDEPDRSPKHKPELRRAVALANQKAADLLIPNIGNLSMSIHFVAEVAALNDRQLYSIAKPGKDLIIAAMDVGTLAYLATNFRNDVAKKTKARLQELKAQGVRLGSPDTDIGLSAAHAATRIYADEFAREVMPIIRDLQGLGFKTLTEIARMLNARGVDTQKGGQFHPTTVKNIITRSKYL